MSTPPLTDLEARLVRAAEPHVPFDGWSVATLKAAARDAGVPEAQARATFSRGGAGLAAAAHRMGDAAFREALAEADLDALRYRDKVARAVRLRIEAAGDREAVRRASALFALPGNAALGTSLIWDTADAIWTALGDTSDDINWYSKRAILSSVYTSTVLFWLGDDSAGAEDTWAFLDRRIDNVMQFEKAKGAVRKAPLLGPLARMAGGMLSGIKAPTSRSDLPGTLRDVTPEEQA